MSNTARRVLIEYRIPKKDFTQAVRHYATLFLGKVPEPIPDDQLIIEVFKVPNDDEYFQCELCLTCVPEDATPTDNVPLVFWGADATDAAVPLAPEDSADEPTPTAAEPVAANQVRHRSFAEREAGIADAFGNRTGFIINPDFP
ncbi:hypothetical protein [Hymenobacter sp. APR13]|uniref:hypothetical protein n=1 Tax=Hymenobacter sp. APR13 TaxID=1356852 RepID=UPI0004E05327|nr:hypothetical protein [Hymenobacter sp. APR13]AII52125.1 hypothetical protein N008_09060 [Hymenobacter sp. APR13]